MGGFYYTTSAGDMWDYIAWKIYSDSYMMPLLLEANENRNLIDTYVFSAGVSVWCPYVEETDTETDMPDWRDNE